LKEEGNQFFKQKDYKKAISKYVKVQLYIKPLAPPESTGGEGDKDPGLAMAQNMKQFEITPEEMEECRKLQGTSFLNLSICHYML